MGEQPTERLGTLIQRLRLDKGLTQGQLATYAKVGRSWLSLVEGNRIAKPERDKLERLAPLLGQEAETLLAIAGYRTTPLPVRNQRPSYEIVRELEATLRRELDEAPIEVPIIGYASAGPGAPVEPFYAPPTQRGRPIYQCIVTGDCMAPALERGDRVIFDEDLIPQPGDLVVAQKNDERIVKRYYGDEFRGDDGSVVSAAGWDILGTVFRSVKIWRQHKSR